MNDITLRHICLREIFPTHACDEVCALEVRDNVRDDHHHDDGECTGEDKSRDGRHGGLERRRLEVELVRRSARCEL